MRHLDLFSGIGGFALAARRVGWQTVAFCESEPFCQAVLRKHWPDVPIHPDVRELKADAVGSVDIITGGYPCQPFSLAGRRAGADDDRHLWPAMHRLVDELRPSWVLGENVAGHVSLGLDDVLSDLERSGYACRAFAIPAVAVDARHRRERLWIVANADEGILRDYEQRQARRRAGDGSQDVSDSAQLGCGQRDTDARGSGPRTGAAEERRGSAEPCRWEPEPDVGRVAHGVPARVDRLRALGNAIVPQVAEEIFRAIMATSSGDST